MPGQGAPTVSAPEAASLTQSQGHSYLDVRTPEEFSGGHAPKAVNVPLLLKDDKGELQPNPEFLKTVQGRFQDKGTPLVVACGAGKRASRAVEQLQQAGYQDLKNFFGGWTEWSAHADLPVEK